ncbi:MAG: hypothetical protein HYZ53_20570 [Planctomycetes bacterium]|nr:hypothetical protein [Planctomycetota bacterium]
MHDRFRFERRRRGAVDGWLLAIVAMLLGVAALGVWIWLQRAELERLRTADLKRGEKEAQELMRVKKQIAAIRRNSPVSQGGADAKVTVLTLLDREAQKFGFKPQNIAPLTPGPPRQGFTEHGYKVQLKDATREGIAKYVFNIENQDPFLKAKDIELTMDEFHKVKEASLTFVLYTH